MARVFHVLAMLCALIFNAPAGVAGETVTVFGAASLKSALDELAAAFDDDVAISYGGSGAMARQVALGAPADLVVLANSAWMDWLDEAGVIVPKTRVDLLGNQLVLVGPSDSDPLPDISAASLLARLDGGRLALGHLQAVPAGIYTRQWLETAGFLADLQPYLAETENVRAALALVTRGEAPLGVVYRTDAMAERRVVVLYEVPDEMHDPISYPAALINSESNGSGELFLNYLKSAKARDVFLRHGFRLPGEPE